MSPANRRAAVRGIGLKVRANLLASELSHDSDEHLTGLCALASIALAKSLHRWGIECFIVEGFWKKERHVWNLVARDLVDLTLTQFEHDAEPVAINPEPGNFVPVHLWESVSSASDSTWVSEVRVEWPTLIVPPPLKFGSQLSELRC